MTVYLCLDEKNGMLFHNRRQSRDRAVRADILRECAGSTLWMDAYSASQFEPAPAAIVVAEDCLARAGIADSCFVERQVLAPWVEKIGRLVIYRWNRAYPSDTCLDVSLENWKLFSREEFSGYSHETITKEVYRK